MFGMNKKDLYWTNPENGYKWYVDRSTTRYCVIEKLKLEMQVRRSVIEAFAKTWIKTIGNNEQIANQVRALKDEAYNRANEFAKQELGISIVHGELSANAQSKVKQYVLSQLDNIVEETVKRELRQIDDKILHFLDLHIESKVQRHVKEYNKERIYEVIERALNEK